MQSYEVNFSIRPDNFLDSGRSDLQHIRTTVQATHSGQAQAIVESQHGGPGLCVVHGVTPLW